MTTKTALIEYENSFDGYTEGPRNNETIFGAWCGTNFMAWCHAFQSYCFWKCGMSIGKIASCVAGVAYWRDQGRLFSTPEVGDLAYFWHIDLNRYGHVALVIGVDGDWIITREGNSNKAGSRTGGSCVSLRRKWRGTRTVFGRPDYAPETAPTTTQPSTEDLSIMDKHTEDYLNMKFGELNQKIDKQGGEIDTLRSAVKGENPDGGDSWLGKQFKALAAAVAKK